MADCVRQANGCFNWFQSGDIERGHGEAASIRQMVATMVSDHGIDPARVFVTGLSAGGAMTSVMLATYPEVFAGGAIIAGLPYGAATNMQQAFETMYRCPPRAARAWGELVRRRLGTKGRGRASRCGMGVQMQLSFRPTQLKSPAARTWLEMDGTPEANA